MTFTDAPVDLPGGGPALALSVVGSRRRPHLVVAGQLDATTAEQFRTRVEALIEHGARSVVIDLGQAEITDSAGAQALRGALGDIQRQRGEMILKSPRSNTLRVLHLAGLSDVFPVY